MLGDSFRVQDLLQAERLHSTSSLIRVLPPMVMARIIGQIYGRGDGGVRVAWRRVLKLAVNNTLLLHVYLIY